MSRKKNSKHRSQKTLPKALRALERGLRALEAGNVQAAEECLRTAVKIAPRYEEASFNLALLLARTGRPAASEQLVRESIGRGIQSARLWALLARLLMEGKVFDGALEAALSWVRLAPDDGEAQIQLGRLYGRLGHYDAAAQAFDSVLSSNPEWLAGHFERALVLIQAGRDGEVCDAMEQLFATHKDDLAVAVNISVTYRLLGDVERAMAVIQHAETLAPDDVDVLQSLGLSYMDTGEIDKAEAYFERALAKHPDDAGIWYNRVRLRRFSVDDEERINALAQVVGQPGRSPMEQATAEFALGKVLNDLGRYEQAFVHFNAGNRLRAQLSLYDPEAAAARVRGIVSAWPGGGDSRSATKSVGETTTLVLIVGMPRSGTTLVEQILSRHSAIHAAGEQRQIPALIQQLQRLCDGQYPEIVELISQEQWFELRGEQQRRQERLANGKQMVTDKLPTNFEHLGLAAHVFANLKIVHCRRNAMDTCFANYIQLFTEGHDYAYDLQHIAHYYRLYRQLMGHWERILTAPILHVDYEAVVDDLPVEAHRLVDFLGLEWEAACAEHTGAQRVVTTASNWQVRQPIYRDATYRWKRYGELLRPLREALQEYAMS